MQIFQALRSGQVALRLHGHAVGSYRDVEARFGPPLPLQLAPPTSNAPGFATWLVRFGTAVVRVLGRYRNRDTQHAWLVEASDRCAMDAVRGVLEAGGGGSTVLPRQRRQYVYDAPPPSFHAALGGKRPG